MDANNDSVTEVMNHYKSLFDFYKSEYEKAELQRSELQKVYFY